MITVYGANTTRADLAKVKIVTPEAAGRRWHPIPHAALAGAVAGECEARGWRIKEERYALGRKGADMAGAMLLEGVAGVEVPKGQTLALGFLHSNAMRKSLQVTVGSEVAVCNNGMCSGSILMQRKHDRTVDLEVQIHDALDQYVAHANTLALDVRRLQECELPPAQASEILLAAGRAKLIGWAAVGRVDKEYRKPTFSDHGRDNSWALLNAFTYAARKNINPVGQMTAYNEFRKMLPVAALN